MFKLLILLPLFVVFGACKEQAVSAPKAPPAVPVLVAAAIVERLAENLSLVGNLLADESIEIKSEIDGVIDKVLFEEGKNVARGEVLMELDKVKLSAALAEAEAGFRLSKSTYERNVGLMKESLISQHELNQAAAKFQSDQAGLDLLKRQLRDASIIAPFAGIVGSRTVSPGQVISKSSILTWLVALDPIKVEFKVPERFLDRLSIGQTIETLVASYGTNRFVGEVYFVAPAVDPVLRTVLVKARIPNKAGLLRPGMFANLNLTLKVDESALMIPESALIRLSDNSAGTVYVVGADETVQVRKVKLGSRIAGKIHVIEGLKAGEKVITEGSQKVGPGSKVKTRSV